MPDQDEDLIKVEFVARFTSWSGTRETATATFTRAEWEAMDDEARNAAAVEALEPYIEYRWNEEN